MANPCLTLSNEVRAVLAPYRNQAAASGKDLALAPEAALTLSLVLHELVTNAAKHGALSVPDGRVEVGWRVDEDGAARPIFCLDWAERDGPPVVPPAGVGFGRSLIEEMPQHDLQAEVRLSFWAKGLAYALAAPLAAIAA